MALCMRLFAKVKSSIIAMNSKKVPDPILRCHTMGNRLSQSAANTRSLIAGSLTTDNRG